MFINIRGAAMAGLIWGIVALAIALLMQFVPAISRLIPSLEGLTLAAFALLFAGVHYATRSKGGLFDHLIGGIFAGVIAGLFLLVVGIIIPAASQTGVSGDIAGVLVLGIIAGAFGALGMEVVKRFGL